MMEASIPKGDSIRELHLIKCDQILVNGLSSGLKKFVLSENQYTEFSEEQALVNCTVLEELEFDLRGFVKSPSLDLHCNDSLGRLEITGWHSSSLPFSLHLFTNLQDLYLYDFPRLESFPKGGLPPNLGRLIIQNCPKLIASREEWGLFQLYSLKTFVVSDVESFPEENLLPPNLESLYLENCSKLRIMNYKGFLHLNSLKDLYIEHCPSLESLPEKGLLHLNSLTDLYIKDCPSLESLPEEGLPSSLSYL
ncbi:CC-NBS-LRR resistance protein, partial [Trifolium medium]|nr:CC-NBS-LRR resistance protein [Trifolium medium]